MKYQLTKILSGGQTGADRAALDWAIARSIPHGGWCPKGRIAEDGRIAPRYQLTETSTEKYSQRTEANVKAADGTVIFTTAARLTGGSRRTAEFARHHGKPWLHLAKDAPGDAVARLREFVARHGVRVLNVAGSRASKEPSVGEFVRATLEGAFPRHQDRTVMQLPPA